MKLITAALLFLLAVSVPATSQTWDNSGNGLLKGSYYFRNVIWLVGDDQGDLGRAIALYGTINFDGNGNYTIQNSQAYDSNAGQVQTFSTTGTYSISASGYGFLSSPVSTGDVIFGLVAKGIFIASSTEAGYNDLMIAAPAGSGGSSNAAFKGSYTLVDVDFPTGDPTDTRDSQFQLNPDGNGNIGTVQATGYIGGRGSSTVTQNIAGVRYFVSSGAAVVSLGGSLTATNLLAGTKYVYISADGDFVFGGSPTAWDMFVGVRSGGGAPSFNGLYYQAGVIQDESQLANGFADLDTYYGSLKPNAGVLLSHQRLLSVFQNSALDYTYADSYNLNADGTYDDAGNHYLFGPGGAVRIGLGKNPSIGINVAVQAPTFTPSGVFIDPTGVVNAGSSALFTSGITPGELITIYGSNLASSTVADASFPQSLGGVQVTINGRPAPIYVVSPNQISAVVPFATTELIASIQVVNNGTASNTVTAYTNLTSPGVFTKPEGGIGYAAALHADGSLVSAAKPAQPGETISVFVTGLGLVNPAVADGTPGPVNPFSLTTNTITVYIDNKAAPVSYSGLAPQLVGLYQLNVQVPSGVSTGNVSFDVAGPDSYTSQALLPVGTGSGASEPVSARRLRLPRLNIDRSAPKTAARRKL